MWIGPEVWANRLQDWRLHRGRIECVETGERAALRTLHVLTHRLDAADACGFRATVRIGAIDGALPLGADAWAGFLIGAGGEHVDHRLSAQVHGVPAEDGGLLALVDGSGRVVFRDMSVAGSDDGQWAMRADTTADDVPVPSGTRLSGDGFGLSGSRPVHLELRCDGSRLELVGRDDAGVVLSGAVLDPAPERWLDGAIALVSHRGPADSEVGFWFEDLRLWGTGIATDPSRAFGPIVCAQYTIDETRSPEEEGALLSLTAQFVPLGAGDTRHAVLEVGGGGAWERAAEAELDVLSHTARFRVPGWDAARDARYRVVYDLVTGQGSMQRSTYEGRIRPAPEGAMTVADVGCVKHYTGGLRWNEDGLWFPHADVERAVLAHDPDLVFFSGDQVYEGDLTPAVRRPLERAVGDYLGKWYRWCWSFRELFRDRPCITVPDDHDVYHGNIWGNAGVRGPAESAAGESLTSQDRGGYTMDVAFVNAVHRTQVSHLPPPHTPEPIGGGISVYHTDVTWGGVSFAVLADRMFKSAPSVVVPDGDVVNGWFRNPDFDPRDADVPGAVLLGERQLAFLEDWSADWSGGAWAKVALSQTPFANVATIPDEASGGEVLPGLPVPEPGEYPDGYRLAADCDSGGWPQSGRDAALRLLRRAAALHLAGDQHLGSTIRYGIDAWNDAGFCLTAPAVGNTWPRRWFPPTEGANRQPGSPRYTGEFEDGFGNRMTVLAIANPVQQDVEPRRLHDRSPGYGILRLERESGRAVLENWPRSVDPRASGARPYADWPVEVALADGDGRVPVALLPELRLPESGWVVQVVRERSEGLQEEVLYTRRLDRTSARLPVFDAERRYTIRADPAGPAAGGPWAWTRGQLVAGEGQQPLFVMDR